MGAVVSVVLLVPALLARSSVDRLVQKKQVALLSARSVPYEPKPEPALRPPDAHLLLRRGGVHSRPARCVPVRRPDQVLALRPESVSLNNYNFDVMDGGGWDSYFNSIRMALYTAVIGTPS